MTAEDCRLQCSFESVRNRLLEHPDEDRLKRPLAFWALPTDRRLPIALLNRTVNELLQTSFEELSATPGIGQKKIHSLVELLERATSDSTVATTEPHGGNGNGNGNANGNGHTNGNGTAWGGFDSETVSDAVWSVWCEAVRRHGLTEEKLGRLAPSLQSLPTVIWETRLGFYVDRSLSEVRELKTHGEKRVRSVLRVFFDVNRIIAATGKESHLAIRLVPRFVPSIEAWIRRARSGVIPLSTSAVRQYLAEPLLCQLDVDAGPTVRELAEGRWGIDIERQSVRAQSRQMGVTRARIYQLFEDCQKIMSVRWPEGDRLLQELLESMREMAMDQEAVALVESIQGLLYNRESIQQPVGEAF